MTWYRELSIVGIAVHDGFLSDGHVHALGECARIRRARGDFAASRVGSGRRLQRRDDIRGDSTCWLEEPIHESEKVLLAGLEQLRLDLNREALLGLFDLELHYAFYPPGSGYARHLDRLQSPALGQRVLSFVLYLNPAWERGLGGELRLFVSDDHYRDVEPRGGRLVCFLSSGQEHEVLTTHCERLSISGWFRGRK